MILDPLGHPVPLGPGEKQDLQDPLEDKVVKESRVQQDPLDHPDQVDPRVRAAPRDLEERREKEDRLVRPQSSVFVYQGPTQANI